MLERMGEPVADAVEMGADLGGQNRLGLILLDHVFVKVFDQLFRLQIEGKFLIDIMQLFGRGFLGLLALRENAGRDHLYLLAVFAGQIIGQFLFEFLLIRQIGFRFTVHLHFPACLTMGGHKLSSSRTRITIARRPWIFCATPSSVQSRYRAT